MGSFGECLPTAHELVGSTTTKRFPIEVDDNGDDDEGMEILLEPLL